MARLVYFAPPFRGHVNPALALVHALVQQGHEVHFFCTAEFAQAVEEVGGRFHAYPSRLTRPGQHLLPVLFGEELHEVASALYPVVRDLAPQLAVVDLLCPWGRALALALDLPELTVHATFAPQRFVRPESSMNPNTQRLLDSIAQSLSASKVPDLQRLNPWEVFAGQQRAALICTVPELQPARQLIGVPHAFTGPAIDPQRIGQTFDLNTDRPVIYVSHSTLFGQRSEDRRQILEALAHPRHLLLVSGQPLPEVDFPADQVRFLGLAPQVAVLRQASSFITHAGNSSVMESLACGIPMVCLPGTQEQQITALMATRKKFAVTLQIGHPANPLMLPGALSHVMREEFRAPLREFREHLERTYDVGRAVADMVAQALG